MMVCHSQSLGVLGALALKHAMADYQVFEVPFSLAKCYDVWGNFVIGVKVRLSFFVRMKYPYSFISLT